MGGAHRLNLRHHVGERTAQGLAGHAGAQHVGHPEFWQILANVGHLRFENLQPFGQ